jgi:magnesium-transporting ATPase (P-type)
LKKRANTFGSNKKNKGQGDSMCSLLCENVFSLTNVLFIILASASLLLGCLGATPADPKYYWVDGAAIYALVIVSALTSSVADWRKNR